MRWVATEGRGRFTLLLLVAAFLLALMLEPNTAGLTYVGASPLNSRWDGTSALVNILTSNLSMRTVIVLDWEHAVLPRGKGMVFLISPTKPLSRQEVERICKLVREGYVLVVADEGVYSNAVLEALEVPIRVEGKVLLVNGSPTFVAPVKIHGESVSVEFAYASPLKVWGDAKVIAAAGGAPVAAVYRGAVTAYVFGDGTIFTNAALTPPSDLNPYVRLLTLLKADVGNVSVSIIDAKPYVLRPESLPELLSSGQPAPKVVAAIINPYRYYYVLMSSYREAPLATAFVVGVIALVLVAYVINTALHTLKSYGEVRIPESAREFRLGGPGPTWITVIRQACIKDMVTHADLKKVCEALAKGRESAAHKLMVEALSDKRVREEVLRVILLLSSG